MKEAGYASKVCELVWDMPPLRARRWLSHFVLRLLNKENLKAERPDEDYAGRPLPKIQMRGDHAVIPITGIISMDLPDWIKPYGYFTDANDIEEEVNRALADSNVEFIVSDLASPGGWDLASLKLFELFEAANKKKKCFYYIGDGRDAASGAFYAVAGCTAGLAGWYAAGIGCIGCYLPYLDDTEFWAQMGLKWEVFRSGELKGMGIDALTEPQREYLQNMVNESGTRFRKNVLKHRTGIAPEDLDGRWFEGEAAAKHGFVVGNADNLEAAISKFRRML